jgi:hypothetical protein
MFWLSCACCCFFNIRSTMVSKHSELVKRQARDRYGRFASPSSHTTPPSSRMQKVGSSSRRRTTPPLRQDNALTDDSMKMWVAAPPLRLQVAPPPTHLAAPPRLTRVDESSDDSPSDSSDYNNECPTSKRWAHMNTTFRFQLFSIITKCIDSFSDSKVRK